ncbi:unnamed protein product [Cylindrotheca closterium]|uniref:GOLD domain-containing protein n=1 Tax=Cylindrotheca closterium TaxID=2856 RepID=A0AAD2CSU0_9STRA|nr:unnamed protein product [Cylindrotheca closterium]
MFKQHLLIASFLSLVSVVHCKPYILLTSSRNKCFNVVAPPSETIEITYEAPDVDGVQFDPQNAAKMDGSNEESSFGKDGLDSAFNKRMQRKLERFGTPGLTLTVSQKLQNQVPIENRNDEKGRSYGVGRMREDCKKEGSLLFQTSEGDGIVNVCIHALGASIDKPMRIYINVVVDEDKATDSYEPDKEAMMKQAGEVKETMTRLERDFQSLTNRVRTISNSADYNKEQEVEFHDHSVSMNRAASYWPIIRLVFLIITGIAQANHIIGFMKAHRIS